MPSTEIVRYLQGFVWRRQVPRTKEEWDKQQADRQWSRDIQALADRVKSGELTLEEAFPGAKSRGDLRRKGFTREEVLQQIEDDPASCYRPPDFWRTRR